ncbi:UDP-glucosyltransferase 2-like [Oratosquilla oratoria]|uniref:UDP-glucosyltransferase 2-like n=1 Tax=Oratosquilla oratoria TaxID=337810 RepID=UPI003F75D353
MNLKEMWLISKVVSLGSLVLLFGMTGTLHPCRGDVTPSPEEGESYKILMLLPISSKSHRNLFMPIAEGLAERGHKVTMLSNHPPASSHANVHEIYHKFEPLNDRNFNPFITLNGTPFIIEDPVDVVRNFTKYIYTIPEILEVYERRHEFNVVILSAYLNDVMFPFVEGNPLIILVPQGLDHRLSALMGNVLNPAYVIPPKSQFQLSLNLLGRMKNIFSHISSPYMNSILSVIPAAQEELSKIFPSLPAIEEMRRNVSLALLNTDYCLEGAVPLLPSQIQIGCLQCHSGRPLPQELLQWIEGAGNTGVIYFSLGSLVRVHFMPKKFLDIFLAAFAMLPYRVIWKHDGEMEGVPDNILLGKWLPQQDILAHENVKVFITHGGYLSLMEGLYHATPLLALPVTSDQPRNSKVILEKGFGLALNWKDLTAKQVVDAVTEIMNNSRYKEKTAEVSSCLQDQPEMPLERALWWTEYVIRHQGAPALASPGADLSWTEYLLLDVLFVLEVILFLVVWLMYKLKGKIAVWLSSKKKAKTE